VLLSILCLCWPGMQGSTELWEWDSQLASEAFKLHDRVLRQYMTQVRTVRSHLCCIFPSVLAPRPLCMP
jgi:hypothetical protein